MMLQDLTFFEFQCINSEQAGQRIPARYKHLLRINV